MLLIKSAKERVVGFLLEMAKRVPSISGHVELPMSRQDIADYLGLTIETVSRSFSDLEDDASIQLMSARKIALRNRRALGQLNA
jgi:CRP-like cAMP-binding protein